MPTGASPPMIGSSSTASSPPTCAINMEDDHRFFKFDLVGGARFPGNVQQPIQARVVLIHPGLCSATHQQLRETVMDTEARPRAGRRRGENTLALRGPRFCVCD